MPDSNLAGPKPSSARRRTDSFPQLQVSQCAKGRRPRKRILRKKL